MFAISFDHICRKIMIVYRRFICPSAFRSEEEEDYPALTTGGWSTDTRRCLRWATEASGLAAIVASPVMSPLPTTLPSHNNTPAPRNESSACLNAMNKGNHHFGSYSRGGEPPPAALHTPARSSSSRRANKKTSLLLSQPTLLYRRKRILSSFALAFDRPFVRSFIRSFVCRCC